METKEAIEFIENEIDYMDYVAFKKEAPFEAGIFQQKKDVLISLLQQGEKYKQMWEGCKKHNSYDGYVGKIMNDFERKYFPKEVKQDEANNRRSAIKQE